jgi:hypothetical protein
MKATYTFVYNRKNKLNKQGEALVQIQVYYNKERKYLSTGIYLKPNEWDNRRNEVNRHHPECDVLNEELQAHVENLKTYERNEFQVGRSLALSALTLENFNASSPGLSFTEYWQQGIENNNQLEFRYETCPPLSSQAL